MGCGNCGSGKDGKPSGCKSNGGCSSGGCNRMNVHDWLSTLPLSNGAKPYSIVEISFNKGSRKDYYLNNSNQLPEKGDWVAVEGVSGFDLGQVSLSGELVKLQLKKYNVDEKSVDKKILRKATDEDIETYRANKSREVEMLIRSRVMARDQKLDMKLCEVEIQADGKKATFFYTADQRVDFRELIRVYATDFKVKVEMRQIGARQESAKVGGIGSCGRELCCSTWLSDFKSVNTSAARYQNLSINQTKLSGQCGRLKCCLNYELDTYMEALSVFPENADSIETIKGNAYLQKRDIFKNLMWYSFRDSNKQYPLSIERVNEILELNKAGKKPDELGAVELDMGGKENVKVDVGFVNDVGQITLKSLEKGNRKKKKKSGNKPNPNQAQGQRTKGNNQGQPQGQKAQNQRPPRGNNERPPRKEAVDNKAGNDPKGSAPQQKRNNPRPPQDRQGNNKRTTTPQGQQRRTNHRPNRNRPNQRPEKQNDSDKA